jgi:hypothetical protein
MGIGNKVVLDFVELILIVFVFLIIFIDFGFNVKELITFLLSAFSTMTLSSC